MKASPLLTVYRGVSVLYAIVVVVLTLLPADRLAKWAPFATQRALDPSIRAFAAYAALATGLLLLAALALALALWWRPRIAPRLRLSWPLLLVLAAYVTGLALVASGNLRAAVWGVALEDIPDWLDLATDRLALAAGHALAYVGLGVLLALAWGRQLGLWPLGLLALALSGVVEALQELVPRRTPSGWDLLANGLGLTAGLTAGGLLIGQPWSAAFRGRRRPRRGHRRRRRRSGPPERAEEPEGV